jgi:hypothetical protein
LLGKLKGAPAAYGMEISPLTASCNAWTAERLAVRNSGPGLG